MKKRLNILLTTLFTVLSLFAAGAVAETTNSPANKFEQQVVVHTGVQYRQPPRRYYRRKYYYRHGKRYAYKQYYYKRPNRYRKPGAYHRPGAYRPPVVYRKHR